MATGQLLPWALAAALFGAGWLLQLLAEVDSIHRLFHVECS